MTQPFLFNSSNALSHGVRGCPALFASRRNCAPTQRHSPQTKGSQLRCRAETPPEGHQGGDVLSCGEGAMMQASQAKTHAQLEEWREVLTKGHTPLKFLQRCMRLLPGPPRCKICNNPFGGFGGRVCRMVGMHPSKKNPRICASCCENMPLGGAEIETAILFADIRNSTGLAETLGPTRYAEALNRFYALSTDVLIRHDATVDKLIGDEVMAFFIPGFAGPHFKRSAVEAAQDLLKKLGYGAESAAFLPIGIGIDAGIAFVGNVGGEDYFDFTALGDPVNTAERIQAAASAGELLVSEAAFSAVAERYPGIEPRHIYIRGKEAQVPVYSLPLQPSAP
jgi:adenylate cyclase